MATTASIPARSLHGCWTCRVRKKKCDEHWPVCSTCTALNLECHRNSDRPIWMDHGPLQREQAKQIKQLVRLNNPKGRHRRIMSRSPTLSDTSSQMDDVTEEASEASNIYFDSSAEGAPLVLAWNNMVLEDEVSLFPWNMDLTSFENGIPRQSFQESRFTVESTFNSPDWESNVDSNFPSGNNPIPPGICGTGWSWNGLETPTQLFSANKISGYSMVATNPEESSLGRDMEDKLLMHYLDEVFYIQYPFYNSRHKQSRSWLFSTIRRVKSSFYATLALSQHHMQSMAEEGFRLPKLSRKIDYYVLALQEMKISLGEASSWSETTSLVRSVECTTSILQVLFCELFAGGTGNWQSHLLTAAASILPLVQARMTTIVSDSIDPVGGTQQAHERDMYFWENTGTEVLLGSLLFFDIIACASTRSQPLLKLDHKHILETSGIDLGSLFGCENQVMTLIFEVVLLDNWKKEAEKAHKLSIVDLVKRGAGIENRLQQKIRDLESTYPLGLKTVESSHSILLTGQTEVTYIFALSAMTYLHVIVSGANPEVVEIAESVSKTIVAFQGLADSRSLRNLVWPFCVSGCLARQEQRNIFRGLVSNAGISHSTVGTFPQAFRIIEECWEIGNVSSHSYDWAFIMRKMGCNVILI